MLKWQLLKSIVEIQIMPSYCTLLIILLILLVVLMHAGLPLQLSSYEFCTSAMAPGLQRGESRMQAYIISLWKYNWKSWEIQLVKMKMQFVKIRNPTGFLFAAFEFCTSSDGCRLGESGCEASIISSLSLSCTDMSSLTQLSLFV